MCQISCAKLLCSALLCGLVYLVAPVEQAQAQARQPEAEKRVEPAEKQRLTPAQAATRARAKHGGKVLKVSPQGKRVRGFYLTPYYLFKLGAARVAAVMKRNHMNTVVIDVKDACYRSR